MRKTCCGFGHRKLHESAENVTDKLYNVILNLISEENVSEFMTGEMGDFDTCFSSAVKRAKKLYPNIKLILVMPYFQNKVNTNKDYYETFYDDIIIPDEAFGCYYKTAITKRNRWMIDNSEYVVSYIRKDHGGAFTAVSYAVRHDKTIIPV